MNQGIIFKPELPSGCDLSKDRVLLHCCCAPCSTAILEWMVAAGVRPGIFFSNSNIVPFEEYEHRRSELVRYAESYGLETVDDEYDHAAWLSAVKGLEREPERGRRCLECFRFRLLRAAAYASEHGYRILTTTLASSRWKDLGQVDEAGKSACDTVNYRNSAYEVCSGSCERNDEIRSSNRVPGRAEVVWWGQNWRKGGLQDRRSCLIREYSLYNQTFCGCEFSKPAGSC